MKTYLRMNAEAQMIYGIGCVMKGKEYEVIAEYPAEKGVETSDVKGILGKVEIRDLPPLYEFVNNKGDREMISQYENGKLFTLVEK